MSIEDRIRRDCRAARQRRTVDLGPDPAPPEIPGPKVGRFVSDDGGVLTLYSEANPLAWIDADETVHLGDWQ